MEKLSKAFIKKGAIITLADINVDRANVVAKNYGANVVDGNSVYDVDMDILCSMLLGSTLNDETISKLNCSIIAGAANNQLKDEVVHGKMLKDKKVYCIVPDFNKCGWFSPCISK